MERRTCHLVTLLRPRARHSASGSALARCSDFSLGNDDVFCSDVPTEVTSVRSGTAGIYSPSRALLVYFNYH